MATIRDVAEVLIKVDDKEAKTKMPELKKQAEELIKTWDAQSRPRAKPDFHP